MYCYLYIEAKPSIFIWFHSDHNKIVMGDTTVGLVNKKMCYINIYFVHS